MRGRFGCINYRLIESGEISDQFNPFGGEERIWFGPEGGPFSIYFEKGKEQVFSNWVVPGVIDTESFDITQRDSRYVEFIKNTVLTNASGTEFKIGIERIVSLLPMDTVSAFLEVHIPADLQGAALQPSESLKHTQRIMHFQGDEAKLAKIVYTLFNLELDDIINTFQ